MRLASSLALGLTLALTTTACLDGARGPAPTDDPALDQTEEGIVSGGIAADWMVERAVKPQYPCTATLVAPRFALTALHCTQYNKVGTTVHFYSDASGFDPALARKVVSVRLRPGTNPAPNQDVIDSTNLHADIALLELDSAAPASSTVAILGWRYPGAWGFGRVVGAGNHDSAGTNDDGELRYQVDVTKSDTDDTGSFATIADVVNAGDSGGPLYLTDRVIGVLNAHTPSSGYYTSVPEHLDWALGQIGYAWPYGASQSVVRFGTELESFTEATERTCQYACDHAACVAYDFHPASGTCTLLSTISGQLASTVYRSDAK